MKIGALKKQIVHRNVIRGDQGKEAGATLVEFALVMIIFLSLIFGIGGFGHALFTYHHINNAAKEATRYAAVRGANCSNDSSCLASNSASGISGPTTQADVSAYVLTLTPNSISNARINVSACGLSDTANCASSGPQVCSQDIKDSNNNVIQVKTVNNPGCTVSVTVAYPYNFIFPFLPVITSTTAPCTSAGLCMSSTSEMIIAH